MEISVEITLYPLRDDYLTPIRAFIARLHEHDALTVQTNAMSTQVFGDYATVLELVGAAMAATHAEYPKAAFVLKVLHGDVRQPQVHR